MKSYVLLMPVFYIGYQMCNNELSNSEQLNYLELFRVAVMW